MMVKYIGIVENVMINRKWNSAQYDEFYANIEQFQDDMHKEKCGCKSKFCMLKNRLTVGEIEEYVKSKQGCEVNGLKKYPKNGPYL